MGAHAPAAPALAALLAHAPQVRVCINCHYHRRLLFSSCFCPPAGAALAAPFSFPPPLLAFVAPTLGLRPPPQCVLISPPWLPHDHCTACIPAAGPVIALTAALFFGCCCLGFQEHQPPLRPPPCWCSRPRRLGACRQKGATAGGRRPPPSLCSAHVAPDCSAQQMWRMLGMRWSSRPPSLCRSKSSR